MCIVVMPLAKKNDWSSHKTSCHQENIIRTPKTSISATNSGYKPEDISGQECAICLTAVLYSDKQELPCGHQFHQQCLDQCKESGVTQLCPLCRQLVSLEADIADRGKQMQARAELSEDQREKRRLNKEAEKLQESYEHFKMRGACISNPTCPLYSHLCGTLTYAGWVTSLLNGGSVAEIHESWVELRYVGGVCSDGSEQKPKLPMQSTLQQYLRAECVAPVFAGAICSEGGIGSCTASSSSRTCCPKRCWSPLSIAPSSSSVGRSLIAWLSTSKGRRHCIPQLGNAGTSRRLSSGRFCRPGSTHTASLPTLSDGTDGTPKARGTAKVSPRCIPLWGSCALSSSASIWIS